MQRDEFGEPVVDALPDFVRHHRFERHGRDFQREIARADMADVDDRAISRNVAVDTRAAYEKSRNRAHRFLRRGQADTRQTAPAQRVEPLEAEREMAAALAARERMDFIDDHGTHGRQHPPARVRAEQHVQRFGRGDENVRRALSERVALLLRGVAGAHGGADVERRQPARVEFGGDALQRYLQVEADVVGKRLERRHVDHQRFVGQRAVVRETLLDEIVERGQERGERFAGTRRRGDERRAATADLRPRGGLRVGRRGEGLQEPAGHRGVEGREGAVRGCMRSGRRGGCRGGCGG